MRKFTTPTLTITLLVNGVLALNEESAATRTVNVVSVQINGATFTPDSSANDSAKISSSQLTKV